MTAMTAGLLAATKLTGVSTIGIPVVGVPVVGVSTVELGLRMGLGLLVTLSILAGVARLARRRLGPGHTPGPTIQIRAQQQLTKHTTIHLLTTGDHNLLIATNPDTTTLLAQGPHLTTTTTTTGTGTGTTTTGTGSHIDIRAKPNPLKQLQNKTVRRA